MAVGKTRETASLAKQVKGAFAPGRKAAGLPRESGPTWEIAYLFPYQGTWSEEEYLDLDTNHLVEFSNGSLEFLPMPTTPHQLLVYYLYGLVSAFITPDDLGVVLGAPLRVRLWPRKFREPDIVFLLKEHSARIGVEYWKGADLVMEVVSGSAEDRRRDLSDKRKDYARAGVSEYWIVDPRDRVITVLRLARKRYVVHGKFAEGTAASSVLLPGFAVDVAEAFAKGESLTGKAKPSSQTKRR